MPNVNARYPRPARASHPAVTKAIWGSPLSASALSVARSAPGDGSRAAVRLGLGRSDRQHLGLHRGELGYASMLFGVALTDGTMAAIIDRYRPLMVEIAAEVHEAAARGSAVSRDPNMGVLASRAA